MFPTVLALWPFSLIDHRRTDGRTAGQTDKLAQKMIIGHSSKVDLSISRLLYGGRAKFQPLERYGDYHIFFIFFASVRLFKTTYFYK